MAETVHVAEIAEKLATGMFADFLWQRSGPTNHNWPCVVQSHGVQTHPSDVVFSYDEPYSQVRTYVQCDLKSYAKDSIKPSAIRGAMESLARQVACAEQSDEWRRQYIHDDVSPEVCGLLFVYNHDGEYDKSFKSMLASVKTEKLDLPRGSRIVVLGPEDIHWLDNIHYELRQMRGAPGQDRLPDASACRFFYPQLVLRANVRFEKAKAATLEMLTSPWVVLEYRKTGGGHDRGVVVFYRRNGATTHEFMYLLDYLRHYQVLDGRTQVSIKTLITADNAHATYKKAVDQYIEQLSGEETTNDLAEQVRAIRYSKITQVRSVFSAIELGMDYD